MKIKHYAILLILTALTACAPATPQGVRDKHSGVYTFTAPITYQQTYRTILNQAKECFTAGLITARMAAEGNLYTDTETGIVSVVLYGGFGTNTYLVVDIKAQTPTSASVVVYSFQGNWDRVAKVVQAWVLDGSTSCKAKKA